MQYFQALLAWWGGLVQTFFGPMVVMETTTARAQIESLVGYSISGYVTTIHCQERKFLCRYDRWYTPNKVVYSYTVFATVTGIAPKAIVEACSLEKSFPKLLHPWMSSAQQKEAAIGAYLDILIHRLQNPA
jgi:hypothetical protein